MVFDTLIFLAGIVIWSALAAYFLLFRIGPSLFAKKSHGPEHQALPKVVHYARPERAYSAHEGFKSFATGPELTVEDIVKGLSRGQ